MAHPASSILIHLVFSTRGQEPWITPLMRPPLHDELQRIAEQRESPLLAINSTSDHIHALCNLARTVSVGTLVEDLKRHSMRDLKSRALVPALFQWQAGYGAFSIGQSQVPRVIRFIHEQQSHHQRHSYQDEFRLLLARYRLPCDEEHVWE